MKGGSQRQFNPGPGGRAPAAFFPWLRTLASGLLYHAPGRPTGERTSSRGRYASYTRKGPGRRAYALHGHKPAGSKLWRKAKEGKVGLWR